MSDSERFPFDFDALKKGDAFPPEVLEKLTGHKFGTSKYAFGVMGLRNVIVDELDARGLSVTVAIVKNSLRILTDEEAVEYNDKDFRSKAAGMRRACKREAQIDVANLGPESQKRLARNLQVHGAMVAAMACERRRVTAKIRRIEHNNGDEQ